MSPEQRTSSQKLLENFLSSMYDAALGSTAPSGSPSKTPPEDTPRSPICSSISVIASFCSSSSYPGLGMRSPRLSISTTRSFGTAGEFQSTESQHFAIPALAMSLIPVHPKISWKQLSSAAPKSPSGISTFSGRIS